MTAKKRGRPKKIVVPIKEMPPDEVISLKTLLNDVLLYEFYDRHEDLHEKCPKCNEIWADFIKLDKHTWICEKCGCHFMPRSERDEIQAWKDKNYKRKVNSI